MSRMSHSRGGLLPIVACLLATLAVPAGGQPRAGAPTKSPGLTILTAGLVRGHIVRVVISPGDPSSEPGAPPELALDGWPGGVHAHAALQLIGIPPGDSVPMDLDLAEGVAKVGAVKVGEFPPIPRFTENVRFPVHVTLRRGERTAAADGTVTLLLPTIIVPGYANEVSGRDEGVLAAFRQHGYQDGGPAPTVFWFGYASHLLTLEQAAHALADYVHQTVLPSAYAAKINVVGYSFGGLMARWNVQFDVDGWGALVNRLLLVGVPNEGSLFPYIYRNVPAFLPYAYLAHTPAARAMTPTFPYWRESTADSWSVPADSGNPVLGELNRRPMPSGVQVQVLFGSARATVIGITAHGAPAVAPGDGIVAAASALGLPIQGGSGVPALLTGGVAHVDLGGVGHIQLLSAGVVDRFTAALLQRIDEGAATSRTSVGNDDGQAVRRGNYADGRRKSHGPGQLLTRPGADAPQRLRAWAPAPTAHAERQGRPLWSRFRR